MFHPRTALRAFGAAAWFVAERLRMGILAIATILAVKIVGAMWLPQDPAGPQPAAIAAAGASATARLP
jgi:hypothetical protein